MQPSHPLLVLSRNPAEVSVVLPLPHARNWLHFSHWNGGATILFHHWIREIEHATFTPPSCPVKHQRSRVCCHCHIQEIGFTSLTEMGEQPYCFTICWIRCRLFFSFLCSTTISIRGLIQARHMLSDSRIFPLTLWQASPCSHHSSSTSPN